MFNREELALRIRSDFTEKMRVGSQKAYALELQKKSDWDSISQSTISRFMKKLGLTTRNGYIVETEEGEKNKYKVNLKLFIDEAAARFHEVSDRFIFVEIGNEFTYRAKSNLRELFKDSIFSIFNDDQGNLLILTKGIDSTSKILSFLRSELHIKEL